VQEVLAYFDFLELGHVKNIVSTEAIDGLMLVELVGSETDMRQLGFSKFQSKKIKQRLPHP